MLSAYVKLVVHLCLVKLFSLLNTCYHKLQNKCKSKNKNALRSVESRLSVDKIRSEEANRARAFVTRGVGGGALRI